MLLENLTRREFLRTAGMGVVGMTSLGRLAWGQATASASGERPPNLVVILADDLGYAELGCQGCKDIPTPHIDSIASGGVRFTQGRGETMRSFITGVCLAAASICLPLTAQATTRPAPSGMTERFKQLDPNSDGKIGRDEASGVLFLEAGQAGKPDAKPIGARTVHPNHSYKSGGALEVHFGLGERRSVDVLVLLPGGASHTFREVAASRFLDVDLGRRRLSAVSVATLR